MTAIEYLKWLRDSIYLPLGTGSANIDSEPNGVFRKIKVKAPSNSQLFRWLNEGAVEISEKRLKPNDEVRLPITSLVLFPKSIAVCRDKHGDIQVGGGRISFHESTNRKIPEIVKAIENFIKNEPRII